MVKYAIIFIVNHHAGRKTPMKYVKLMLAVLGFIGLLLALGFMVWWPELTASRSHNAHSVMAIVLWHVAIGSVSLWAARTL